MSELKRVLMRRDSLSEEEAEIIIQSCRDQVNSGIDPEEVLCDIGLEPDYIFDIL